MSEVNTTSDLEQHTDKTIVFFDGVCSLCNGSVDWLMKRDKTNRLHFASLQSELARELLPAELEAQKLDSIVLKDGERTYTESRAVLRICRILGFPYNLLAVFGLLPNFVLNFFYRLVAKNRYRWFGKRETCRLPTKEESAQLLA